MSNIVYHSNQLPIVYFMLILGFKFVVLVQKHPTTYERHVSCGLTSGYNNNERIHIVIIMIGPNNCILLIDDRMKGRGSRATAASLI
ncbi:hypothetical protein BLOT_012188 [Blomia tropicalis]|nr:hypothetical protein BLOT_012188 [Blomia tropicalis]